MRTPCGLAKGVPRRLWCCLVVIVVISGVSVLVLLPLLEEPGHHPRLRSRQSGASRLHLRAATRPPVHRASVGGPAVVQDASRLGVIRSAEDQRIKVEGYHQHAFNVLISNRLGKVRPLPDTRNPQCQKQEFVEWSLPTASVVVCFYNEAWSALLRTVHTVLERSPRALLHELILVDDNSTLPELGSRLAQYVASELPSHVRLIRTPAREGLIRARMHGARNASGEVLVFLDSHCEVNVGWLEPLLARIGADRRTVTCPIIDIINADTFEYSASPIVRGGFNWGLHFKWESPPARTRGGAHEIDPIPSPTMAGGLFAMDRRYFHELGEYDDGMDIWGGENLEISFRIWMCGGRLEILPCSRVGHVFRRRRPYGSPSGEDTLTKNSLRVAHVWMDEYKTYYLQTRRDARNQWYGDVSGRQALRKRLGCRSFDWYMRNVYPELKTPKEEGEEPKKTKKKKFSPPRNHEALRRKMPTIVGRFRLQLSGTGLCVESEDDVTTKGTVFLLQECANIKRQLWYETTRHELRLAQLLCLDGGGEYPRLAKCHEMGGAQDWRHSSNRSTALYNLAAGLCLGAKKARSGEHITLEMCDDDRVVRRWDFRLAQH